MKEDWQKVVKAKTKNEKKSEGGVDEKLMRKAVHKYLKKNLDKVRRDATSEVKIGGLISTKKGKRKTSQPARKKNIKRKKA